MRSAPGIGASTAPFAPEGQSFLDNLIADWSAMAVPIAALVKASDDVRAELKKATVAPLRTMGSFNVLNYEEGLREALRRHAEPSTGRPEG